MVRVWLLSVFCSLVIALPAAAQDSDYDPRVLEGCLESGWFRDGGAASCIGIGAAHCVTGEAGQSTMGLGLCFSEEWAQWDRLLNETYQALLKEQALQDEDIREFNPDLANGVETLRAMQRAWIPFRDAACDWEYSQWGGGSGAGPASAQCMMELTARQTLFLMERLP